MKKVPGIAEIFGNVKNSSINSIQTKEFLEFQAQNFLKSGIS